MPKTPRKKATKRSSGKKAPAKTAASRPATMRAEAIDRFGPPEVLTSHALPVPKVGPKDVLIASHTAGVGIWDAKIREGSYAEGPTKFPLVLGADGAGIVAEVGKDVRRFKPRDEVWAYEFNNKKGGFYAEYAVVKADNVAPLPKELTLLEAGAAAVTGLTALQGVDDHLKLKKTDTVLVFGATGAVGSLAVQFAKRTGANVVATATTGAGERALRDVGIDQVLDPGADDAAARLRAFAPKGLTAVLAFAGGETLERLIDQVVEGGRVGYPNGVEPEPRKRAKIRVSAYDARSGREEFNRLNRAVAEAQLKVVIDSKY
jgi:NADPH2:quinone reductase